MNKPPQGMDDGLGPAADFIHRIGLWAIGGAVLTHQWDSKNNLMKWGLHCDKKNNQKLKFGHQQTLERFQKDMPNSRAFVVWFNDHDQPLFIWYPGIENDERQELTIGQYSKLCREYGTPRKE